jgi:hypothetical protein
MRVEGIVAYGVRVHKHWQERPLATTAELNDAVAELLLYTEAVEKGQRPRINQVPLTIDPESIRRKEVGGLTTWRGVLPLLPYFMLLGVGIVHFARFGPGRWVIDFGSFLGGLFAPLLDAFEWVFGWTAKYSWYLWSDGIEFSLGSIDLATWSPFLGGILLALLAALILGPTRSTWNQALVLRDVWKRR